MSSNADVLPRSGLIGSSAQETALPRVHVICQGNDWNPAEFGREQIRGLVRRIFFTDAARPVKQVVISAAEPHTDVGSICDQVGQTLALETHSDVAIVGREDGAGVVRDKFGRSDAIKSWATRTKNNLWQVQEPHLRQHGEESGTGRYWLSRLAELRSAFEYAVIQGPPAGISSEAGLLGQLADGIILVLDAHSTRRATARKIKEMLEGAHSRILGTVLYGRKFPVPERIYRRL